MDMTNLRRLPDVEFSCGHDSQVLEHYNKIFQYLEACKRPNLKHKYKKGANSQTYPSRDKSYVIKVIDEDKTDFEYSDRYAVIVMERIENSDRRPTKEELKQLHCELDEAGIAHGDMSDENILWDKRIQRFQVIDFGCADCGYEEEASHSFVHEVQNEVHCQQKSNAYGLSPAITAFWFVKLHRDAYLVPAKNFTDNERTVLFALFRHFYGKAYDTPNEYARFVPKDRSITYVDEHGKRKEKIRLSELQCEENRSWLTEARFEVVEKGVRYEDTNVAFR